MASNYEVPLVPRVRADAALAIARNERRRMDREAHALLDFVARARSLHQGASVDASIDRSRFAQFATAFDAYLDFRQTQFAGNTTRMPPASVIDAQRAAWRAALDYAISRPSDAYGIQLDLVLSAANHFGGVADWPAHLNAITAYLNAPTTPQRVKGVLRSHQRSWDALNRTLVGELVMLAGYQPLNYNHRAATDFINNYLSTAIDLARHAGASTVKPTSPATSFTVDDQLRAWHSAVAEILTDADVYVNRLRIARDATPNPASRESTVVLNASSVNDNSLVALVSVAHDDDLNSKFATACCKLKEQGYKVVAVIGTDGSGGDPQNPEHDSVEHHRNFLNIRLRETMQAMKLVGIDEVVFMGYGDSGMAADPSLHDYRFADVYNTSPSIVVDQMAAIFRRYNARFVMTHQALAEQLGNYSHPDHLTMVKAATAASRKLEANGFRIPVYGVSLTEQELTDAFQRMISKAPLRSTTIAPGAAPTDVFVVEPRHVERALAALDLYVSQVVLEAEPFLVGTAGPTHWTLLTGNRNIERQPATEFVHRKPAVLVIEQDASSGNVLTSAIRERLIRDGFPVTMSRANDNQAFRNAAEVARGRHQHLVVIDAGNTSVALHSRNQDSLFDALVVIEPSATPVQKNLATRVGVPFLVVSGSESLHTAGDSHIAAIAEFADRLVLRPALVTHADGPAEAAAGIHAWTGSISRLLSA